MAAALAEEDWRALQELNKQVQAARQDVAECNALMQSKQSQKQRDVLTKKEIDSLEDSVRTYKAVGRMFMIVPLVDLRSELVTKIGKLDEDIEKLTSRQNYVKEQREKLEKELMESVRHHQGQA